MTLGITDLQDFDRERIEAHLLRLSADDRSSRFSAGLVTDDTIRRYVSGLRFNHDLLLGLVSQRGVLFGFAHGCIYAAGALQRVEAAFSVDAEWRKRGLGSRLMVALKQRALQRAMPPAEVCGQCAVRNLAMRRIFAGAGLTLTRADDEMLAHGELIVLPAGCPARRHVAAVGST